MKATIIMLFAICLFSCNPSRQTSLTHVPQGNFSSPEYLQKAAEENDLTKFPKVVSTEMNFSESDRYSVAREMVEEFGLFSFSPVKDGVERQPKLSWRKEEAKVSVFLEKKMNNKMYPYVRQLCALEMFSKTDLLMDRSRKALPVIAKYTDILAEEKNGSPAHFYYALSRLKKYWPKEKLSAVAALGVAGGKKSILGYENVSRFMEKEIKNKDVAFDIVSGYKEINLVYAKYIDRLERFN